MVVRDLAVVEEVRKRLETVVKHLQVLEKRQKWSSMKNQQSTNGSLQIMNRNVQDILNMNTSLQYLQNFQPILSSLYSGQETLTGKVSNSIIISIIFPLNILLQDNIR